MKYLRKFNESTDVFDLSSFLKKYNIDVDEDFYKSLLDSISKWRMHKEDKNLFKLIFRKACKNNRLDILKQVINYVDVNETEGVAIKIAADNGHKDIVQYLLENGANMYLDKAIIWAELNGFDDIVNLIKNYNG